MSYLPTCQPTYLLTSLPIYPRDGGLSGTGAARRPERGAGEGRDHGQPNGSLRLSNGSLTALSGGGHDHGEPRRDAGVHAKRVHQARPSERQDGLV